jgi:hypothetical protein
MSRVDGHAGVKDRAFFFSRKRMLLTARDLAKPVVERSTQNRETYRLIYKSISDHIRRKHESGGTETVVDIPEFVLGRPTFKHSHAARYVTEKLQRGGLRVQGTGGILHVEWGTSIQKLLRRQRRLAHETRRAKRRATRESKRRQTETLSDRLARLNSRLIGEK